MNDALSGIAKFYTDMHPMFVTGGENLHHGIWDANTRNLREANGNSNRFVADLLDLKSTDRVLDAGCGYGGTTIYLAKRFGVRVTGINIVDVQLETAAKHLARAEQSAKRAFDTTFLKRDYLDTGFPDRSFDKICAIESVCYAEKPAAFASEAYRLLAPGGRLVVLDTFQIRSRLNTEEQTYYQQVRETYHARFSMREQFQAALEGVGFERIVFLDKYPNFLKTTKRYSMMSKAVLPFTWLLQKARIIPADIHKATAGIGAFGKLAAYDFCTYGAFVANKPS